MRGKPIASVLIKAIGRDAFPPVKGSLGWKVFLILHGNVLKPTCKRLF